MFQPDPEHRNGRRRGLARMLPDRYTLRRTAMVVTAAVQSWFAHRAASKGAALSFYMLFSLAPILVLVISIAGCSSARKRRAARFSRSSRACLAPRARRRSSRSSPPRIAPAAAAWRR